MSDDLCNDCDCGDCDCDCDCGDCDCDCDCCDCGCADCFPDNNVFVICCCFPPASNNNQSNKTNRGNTSPDCFCCCCSPRRQTRQTKKKKKKKGFCCWRLWWCFGRKEPSPPPSPKRPQPDELSPRSRYRRDGRYPMDDHDFYRDERWAMHDDELDMPPRGRYPMRADMDMYRDELYGRGGGARWDDPRGMRRDYRRRDDRGAFRGMPLREGQRNNEDKASHESREVKPEIALEGHQFESKWSKPVKYEENSAAQTRD